MNNSAVTRALHRSTSAQSLTTPHTEPIPRQLLRGTLSTPTLPASMGLATIVGQQGHQYKSQGAMQLPGMGYRWESSGGGRSHFQVYPYTRLVLFTSWLEPSPDLDSSSLGSRQPWTQGLEPSGTLTRLGSSRLERLRDSSGVQRTRAATRLESARARSSSVVYEPARGTPRLES